MGMDLDRLSEEFREQYLYVAGVLIIVLLGGSIGVAAVSEPSDRSMVLKNNSEIQFFDDNSVGTAIFYNNRQHPVFHETRDRKICIYTGSNSSPLVKHVWGGEDVIIGSNSVEKMDLNLSFKVDEASKRGLNGSYSVREMDRCPLRSGRGIVVTGYSSSSDS